MINVLDSIKKIRKIKFILLNSAAVYKEGIKLKEDSTLEPLTIYGISKVMASYHLSLFSNEYNIESVELRLFMPYSPWEKSNRLIPSLIHSAINNKLVKITSGKQIRDLIYMEDVIEAICKSSEKNFNKNEIINICSSKPIRIIEVVKTIKIILKKHNLNLIYLSKGLKERKDEIWELAGNNNKAKKILNWRPKTSLKKGINKTIQWHIDNSI